MVDTNGDGDVGKLQVIKYIENKTHIDKPDYIERANEYFEQEMILNRRVDVSFGRLLADGQLLTWFTC